MSKQKHSRSGIIYSTDPGYNYNEPPGGESVTLEPGNQKLKIKLETKNRGGKTVTIVEGFEGKDEDKGQLAKMLKTYCGTGGSCNEGEILIQGDNRDKILNWLLTNGYKHARKN